MACYITAGLVPRPPGASMAGAPCGRDLLKLEETELRRIRGRDIAIMILDPG